MNNLKATPSMVTLWHTAATVAGTVLLPVLLGLFQYVSAHGVNVSQDVSYGIPVLVGGLATLPVSIWHAIQASPALPQAEKDVEAQAQAVGGHVANQLGTWLEDRFTALENKFTVHQHAAPTPPVAHVSVPQLAFPQATAQPFITPVAYPNTPMNSVQTFAIGNPGTATVPPQNIVNLPTRSFTQSALMPAVPK